MLIYADKVFENPIEVIEAFCPNLVKPALDKVEFLKNKGLYLVGYMRYDLKNIADNLRSGIFCFGILRSVIFCSDILPT